MRAARGHLQSKSGHPPCLGGTVHRQAKGWLGLLGTISPTCSLWATCPPPAVSLGVIAHSIGASAVVQLLRTERALMWESGPCARGGSQGFQHRVFLVRTPAFPPKGPGAQLRLRPGLWLRAGRWNSVSSTVSGVNWHQVLLETGQDRFELVLP